MTDYHPSQQISPKFEALYTEAILKSLCSELTMVNELSSSSAFAPSSLDLPELSASINFSQKLGHLYEDALALLLEHSQRYDLIAKNKQIISAKKQTLGELDYILFDKESNTNIHLELAIKFYLIHHTEEGFCYPGPDARDNYQRKLSRLCEHQLKLTQREEAKDLLRDNFGITEIHAQHLIHGVFFEHIKSDHPPLPASANPQTRRHKWVHCCELSSYFPSLTSARVLPKALWLCDITPAIFETLVEVPVKELIALGQQRCTMCLTEIGEETFFLAPDLWPKNVKS